ncbi:MAG TPA: iron-sulfur cluster insertion protein ErpA [Kiloniellales bacterium]
MGDSSPAVEAGAIALSERAVERLAAMLAKENRPGLMLRVAVSGGGCAGFQYGFSFDDTVAADDRTFSRDGVTAVIDEASLGLLAGSEIDYVEDLVGAAFQVKNPNATSSCGCGSSFSV